MGAVDCGRQGGRREDVRVGEEDARGQNGGYEEGVGESGFGTVENVPEGGIDEGEGKRELERGLPRKSTLLLVSARTEGRCVWECLQWRMLLPEMRLRSALCRSIAR